MFLYWKIRYLDRADKQFKDRYLYLNTRTLNAPMRAAVELTAESKSLSSQREILKYRHLFIEGTQPDGPRDPRGLDTTKIFCLHDYFEDESCKEITPDEMAQILSGSPTARAIPRGARQHDLDLMLAEPKPMPFAEVSLSAAQARLLGYFVRDLDEMSNSAFMKDGPGTLTSGSDALQTAVTDEEIRSFVTIFRRLYMDKEPANFKKAVDTFATAIGDHPYVKWVKGTAKQYEDHLDAVPDLRPISSPGSCEFTTKRLIDVFLYTQYAHQPDNRRQYQYEQCLAELNGQRALLTWMFLIEIWKCAIEIGNAGNIISSWFRNYCDHHKVSPDVLKSLRDHHSGFGAAEKEEDRRKRLFNEKVEEVADELWEQAGRPEGGSKQYLATAREQLTQLLA